MEIITTIKGVDIYKQQVEQIKRFYNDMFKTDFNVVILNNNNGDVDLHFSEK